jgi:hypothetical protein
MMKAGIQTLQSRDLTSSNLQKHLMNSRIIFRIQFLTHIITDINLYKKTELDEITNGKSLTELQDEPECNTTNNHSQKGMVVFIS